MEGFNFKNQLANALHAEYKDSRFCRQNGANVLTVKAFLSARLNFICHLKSRKLVLAVVHVTTM